jgi:hypothetical protein
MHRASHHHGDVCVVVVDKLDAPLCCLTLLTRKGSGQTGEQVCTLHPRILLAASDSGSIQ